MKITAHLFEAYTKCSTKCWLLFRGDAGLDNAYADWVRVQNESYRSDGVRRLLDDLPQNVCTIALREPLNHKATKWRIAMDVLVQAQSLESCLHAVERIHFEDRSKSDQFIPIRFVFTNKITQNDKLHLAFDALILTEM